MNKRTTVIAMVMSIILFLVAAPFAKLRLPALPPFIAAYDSTLMFNSLLTSMFFFIQSWQSYSRKLLVLASGYLFAGLIVIPHVLAPDLPPLFNNIVFPRGLQYDPLNSFAFTITQIPPASLFTADLFTPGLIGGNNQTTGWLNYFWHGGFPLFIIAYAMIAKDARSPKKAIPVAVIGIVLLVYLLTLLVSQPFIMPLIVVNSMTPVNLFAQVVELVVWVLGIIALFTLVHRMRSFLDLWLVVVMSSWVFDVSLANILSAGRYDVGYYVGKVFGLEAASFILVMSIIEASRQNHLLMSYSNSLEMQLIQAQKMEAIGTLTGGMAHDFNNLLGIIIGNIDMLDGVEKSEEADLLQEILDAALVASRLTKMMLAFASRQPLEPQRTDVNKLITDITTLLAHTLGDIKIRLNLAANVWPVMIDPVQLETTITNLTINARDALSDNGCIAIATNNQSAYGNLGDFIRIEVSDNGTGIPPTIIDRIFDPFFTTKQPGKGTGLGLSMVYGFVKQSNGYITVTSKLGVGTTFRLYFPRTQ